MSYGSSLREHVFSGRGIDLDVKAYFDSMDWELMLRAVRRHTNRPWVLLYIERWLKAPMQMEDGSIVPRMSGTPQGGVISPILANLFLHYAFDMWMVRRCPHIPFERYAVTPFVIARAPRRRRCYGARLPTALRPASWCCIPRRRRSSTARMRTDAATPIISFDFLGFQFRARKTMWREGTKRIFAHSFQPATSPKALTFISRTIRRWTLHHSSDKSLPNLAEMYNPCIRGWIKLLQQLLPNAVAFDPEED